MCTVIFLVKDRIGYRSGAVSYAQYALKCFEACKKIISILRKLKSTQGH